jgi:hypothetical protein
MSVFQVQLNNTQQGTLDFNPTGAVFATNYPGGQMQPSIQRTIYVAGPNRTYRKLFDGQQFTDCNYWKRFAYPQVPLDQAFITVVSDDGSVYSDNPAENTFPKVYTKTVSGGSTFSSNLVDILGDTGGYASFVQVTNEGSQSVQVRINGLSTAVFTLPGNATQVFNVGDLQISRLEIDNSSSGATTTTVQILLSILSKCYS